jgi:uncharacterized protein YecT (DUF1311 family)
VARALGLGIALVAFAAAPSQAFDCAKAKTAVELAICANPDLVQSDLALERVYQNLRASLDPAGRNSLAISERRWVFRRDNLCGGETGVQQIACIAREQEERKHLLSGTPFTGPGTGSRLMPVFLAQEPSANRYEVDYALLKFAEPRTAGEQAFNRAIETILVGAPMGTTRDTAPEGGALSSSVLISLTYASPGFISAKSFYSGYEGGAHGNSGTTNINFDLETGQPLAIGDIFDAGAQDRLFEQCKRQILEKKTKNMGGEPFDIATDANYSDATVREYVGDLTRWTFGQSFVTISFDAYAIGSYAEGPYECEFDTRKLAKFATDRFPIR